MIKRMVGLTLPELLVALSIVAVVAAWTAPGMRALLTSQTLVSRSNQLVALIHSARARAVAAAPVLICSRAEHCETFHEPSDALLLVRDLNDNRRLDEEDEVELGVELPDGMTVMWRSFRGKPWLRINRRGVAFYQNGHFLLCYGGKGRKVIVNYQALPRIEPVPENSCPA